MGQVKADLRVRSGGSVPNKPLATIVSPNYLVLVFWGIAQSLRDIRCKMGYRIGVCLFETKYQVGASHYFGEL